MRSSLFFFLLLLAVARGQTIYPVTDVTTSGSQITSATANSSVFVQSRLVGATVTGFAGVNSGVVLVPGGTNIPASGTRAGLLGDLYLDSGLINPTTTTDSLTLSFSQPIVNRPGPDIMVFEINTGSAADPCNVKINGVTVAVAGASYGNTGYGIASADLYNAPAFGTLAQVEAATLTVNSSDISQTVFGFALDLSDFGIEPGASINSMSLWSSNAAGVNPFDPVLICGIVAPTEQTGGPVIEELMADNEETLEDEDLDHPDWIEIYNGQDAPVNLAGWHLSDTPGLPGKWTFPSVTVPAYGTTYVFASGKDKFTNAHPHTNFTLQKEGGTVLLTRPDNSVASTITYPAQVPDISYGALGAAQTLGYLETPSPGMPNSGRQAAGPPMDDPVFSTVSAVVTGNVSLGISLPATAGVGAQIRYAFGNSDPTESSTLYTGAIPANGTTVSARVFQPGRLPSRTGHRSFVQLGSNLTAYNGTGQPFSSNLPIVVLDSFGNNINGTTDPLGVRPHRFSQAAIYDVNPATGLATVSSTPTILSRSGVHVRGQSSSGFAQKPYAVEFWKEHSDDDKDVALLGFPADSDWVLQTLHADKTFMRNYTMQSLMFEANGQNAGRRCRFVEVIFNQDNATCDYGDYRGVYLLIERIKRNSSRVALEKLNPEMTAPELISGGYIFKKDKTPYDSPFTLTAVGGAGWTGTGITYDIFEPEPPNPQQLSALKSYLNQATAAIMQGDFSNTGSANYYEKWLDPASFIDKQIWQETCKEVDSYTYSYYYSKDRGGKLRAFPFWDVDRSLGNANYGTADNALGWRWWTTGGGYGFYPRLFLDAEFTQQYWDRWWKLRRGTFDTNALMSRIEATASLLTNGADAATVTNTAAPAVQNPAARHFKLYTTLEKNSFSAAPPGQLDRNTYRKELDLMKAWLTSRVNWIDAQTAGGMRPPDLRNFATSQLNFGGSVAPNFQLAIVNPNETGGTLYYTINGADPRTTGGAVAAGALTASGGSTAYTTLKASGGSWKYLEAAAAPAASWNTSAFDDSSWLTATAPFGYGESGLTTTLAQPAAAGSPEPNPVYFRSTFTVANAAAVTGLNLELLVDDGAVVYINGVEAARAGMPYPPTLISFTTEASSPVDFATAESMYHYIKLNPALLVTGTNTIAIEVHQAIYASATAQDMRFDARLKAIAAPTLGTPITLGTSGSYTVRARQRNGTTWSPITEAVFPINATPASAANLTVTELMYHPLDSTPTEIAAGHTSASDFEFIEFCNIGASPIDLTGVQLADAVTFNFNDAPPAARYLSAGERLIVVGKNAAFQMRYQGNTALVAGEFVGNLSNSGEQLTILASNGSVIRRFTYGDAEPWSVDADGSGASLVLNDAANLDPTLAVNWHASASIGGAPGLDDHTAPPANPLADTNGNGLSDLLEYATGNTETPAFTFENYTPPNGTPSAYAFFRFHRNLAASGVTCGVETTSTFASWSGSTFVYVGTVRQSDGTAIVTYRSTVPAAQLPMPLFARLKVAR